jgi:hypothetical protein
VKPYKSYEAVPISFSTVEIEFETCAVDDGIFAGHVHWQAEAQNAGQHRLYFQLSSKVVQRENLKSCFGERNVGNDLDPSR